MSINVNIVNAEESANTDDGKIKVEIVDKKEFSFIARSALNGDIMILDHKDIDIIGSYVFECGENENDITGIRKVPISNKEIYEISKYRNPFNHPSVVYKKNKVIEVGGPKKFTDFDDYYLWLRMLKNKAKCINLDYPLLIMRAGASQAQRRGGLDYIYNEINLFYFAYKIHHINFLTFIFNIILRVPVRLLPYKLRYSLYKLLRKRW